MTYNINPWTYKYIRMLADEATLMAANQGLRPALADEAERNRRQSNRFNIPFLGDYIPEGWVRLYEIEPVFVDTTGRGHPVGSIITQFEFAKRIQALRDKHPGEVLGYGVIELGQLAALVAVYRKEST